MADVLVVGSTGLIGRTFLGQIENDSSIQDVIAVARRKIDSIRSDANIRQLVIDFERLNDHRNELTARSAFCALGTTIKKAGTQENFRHVDYQLPLDIARIVLENGCRNFILISAVGADPTSKVFYNRVKGEVEAAIRTLPFKSIHILRPSLLLGKRDETRTAEVLGKTLLKPFMPLIPLKYRPIDAGMVAEKVLGILKNQKTGVHVYEGAALRSP